MELFLTLKLYLHETELLYIELFWYLTVCKQNICWERDMMMNVIERLDFELAYYDSEVHRFNHYTTRTPPNIR